MATDLQNLKDEELMEYVVNGNHHAFSVIVKRHTDKFYRLSYSTLLNKADAEDVVQTCFIKLWNKPKSFKNNGKVKFTTWFYKVIINACLDIKRKQATTRTDYYDSADIEKFEDGKSGTENIESQHDAVEKALANLNEKQRAAIILHYYDDFSQAEAANIMGVKLKAFESLLHRAKQKLKESAKIEWDKRDG